MLRNAIIFLLISLIRSENCALTDIQLQELEETFNVAEKDMKKEALNENAVICLGTARAGKSTLINYIIGNPLEGVKYSPYGEFKIIKRNNSKGPEIGAGPTSKTKIPTKWRTNKLSGLSIFDSPGFQDNRGASQDIANSIYLYHLVKNVESLKFVLVINFGDILHDSIKPFSRLLLDMEKFFGNKLTDFFPSISVIFSKVPLEVNGYPVDIELIEYTLKERVRKLDETYFNTTIRFTNYLIEHSNRIGLFKTAKSINFTASEIDFHIFDAINSASSLQKDVLQNISPSISDNSLFCLQQTKSKLTSLKDFYKLKKSLSDIFEKYIFSFNNLTDFQHRNTVIGNKNSLYNIKALLTNSLINDYNIYESIETLKKIKNTLNEKIIASEWFRRIKVVQFLSIFPEVGLTDYSEKFFKQLMIHFSNIVEEEISKMLILIDTFRKKVYRINLFDRL